jgi:hypothetical protein
MGDCDHAGSGFRSGRSADSGQSGLLVDRCWEGVIVGLVLLPLVLGVWRPETVVEQWSRFRNGDARQEDLVILENGRLTRGDIEAMSLMGPQQQAEQLLEAAIVHDDHAARLASAMASRWTGSIGFSPRLKALEIAAQHSRKLSVRAAEFDVELAMYNLPKHSSTVTRLIALAEADPPNRNWALISLGMLGNRGVQPERVERVLLDYLDDPADYVRVAAVVGLANLGMERDIPLLLEVLQRDSCARVREQVAQALGGSAMLTPKQRMKTVPSILRFAWGRHVDGTTRGRLYLALRQITRQDLPDDAGAWREWWQSRGSMEARALAEPSGNS